jgi:hypothetical protein
MANNPHLDLHNHHQLVHRLPTHTTSTTICSPAASLYDLNHHPPTTCPTTTTSTCTSPQLARPPLTCSYKMPHFLNYLYLIFALYMANDVYSSLLITATAGTHTGAAAAGLWHCQVCVRCKGCKWGCISQRCKFIKPKMVIPSHDESSDDCHESAVPPFLFLLSNGLLTPGLCFTPSVLFILQLHSVLLIGLMFYLMLLYPLI